MKYLFFTLLFLLSCLPSCLQAATRTWDGGGADNNWATAANWVGDVAPSAGDALVFAGSVRLSAVNNYSTNTEFSSITFSAGAGNFNLSGNAINITGGVTAIAANNTAGTMTISLPFKFTTNVPTITTTSGGTLTVSGNVDNFSWTITCAGTGTLSISGVLSGSGGIIKNGSGTLNFTNTNTYTGGTTLNTGILSTSQAGGFGNISGAITINGGTLRSSRGSVLTLNNYPFTINASFSITGALGNFNLGSGAVTLTANVTITTSFAGTTFFSFAGAVSGGFNIIHAGSGYLAFTGTNSTFTGTYSETSSWGTYVSNLANLSSNSSLGAPSSIANGTINFNGGTNTNQLIFDGSTNTTSSRVINLGGTTGGLSVYNLMDNSYAVTLTSNFTATGSGNKTLTLRGGNTASNTISGIIPDPASGAISLTVDDASNYILSGNNTYTGTTTITSGSLRLGAGSTTGQISNTSNVSNSGSLFVNRSNDWTYTGVVSGTGTLTKQAAGILTLTGTNTYTGITTISAGTLQLGNGGTTGEISNSSNVTNNSALIVNRSNAWTYTGVVSGTGTLTKQAAGTLTLTGTNTYTGITTVSAGVLQIGNGGASGEISSSSNIANATELVVNKTDDWTYGGVISGAGTLEKLSSGTLTLSGNNTFTGDVLFPAQSATDGGTISVTNSGGLGVGPKTVQMLGSNDVSNVIQLSGGVAIPSNIAIETNGRSSVVDDVFLRNLSGDNTWGGNISIVSSGGNYHIESVAGTLTIEGVFSNNHSAERWLRLRGAGDGIYSGVIQDGTSLLNLRKYGAGTWIVTGENTFTGNTAIYEGVLQVGNNGTAGSLPTTGIFNDSELHFFRSDDVSYSAVISGTGSLTKKGAGTLTLDQTNTFSGDIYFDNQSARDDGAILVTNSDGLGSGVKTIHMLGFNGVNNRIELSGGITVDDVAIETNGRNSGSEVFLKNVAGNNTWSGDIKIVGSGGSYQIEAAADLLTVSGNIINNYVTAFRIISLDGSANGVVSGVIQDGLNTMRLTKNSSGTWKLTGTNTYTGLTTINNGILQIGDNGTSGSIASASIINGATLQFYRSDNIEYSGVISSVGQLKKEGAGVLTLSGVNTYTGATIINAGSIEFGVADALGSTDVTINDARLSTGATTGYSATVGTLTITGTNTINLGSGDHTLTFANSSGETWSSFVTIQGWSDVSKYDGTAAGASHPKIFVGSDATGLTAGQLLKIAFFNPDNSNLYEAAILASGEVVPTATVLPVDLLSYTADKRDASVFLNWVTGSEIESDYFVLYHSTNGVDFSELTRIDAADTSTEVINYNFAHNTPAADNFYKLVQVDFDGTTYDKGIRYVPFEDFATIVQVFPNPSSSVFTIKSLTDVIEFYELLDSRGRLVLKSKVDAKQFDMGAQLASGSYLLTVWINNDPQTIKLIKQ